MIKEIKSVLRNLANYEDYGRDLEMSGMDGFLD
jgi:hypothetical protein